MDCLAKMPNEAYNLNKTEKVWVQKSHAPGKGDRERPSLAEYLSCVVLCVQDWSDLLQWKTDVTNDLQKE